MLLLDLVEYQHCFHRVPHSIWTPGRGIHLDDLELNQAYCFRKIMSCTKDLNKIRYVAWVGAEASFILHRKVMKLECITIQLFFVIDEIVLRLKEQQGSPKGSPSRADLSARTRLTRQGLMHSTATQPAKFIHTPD